MLTMMYTDGPGKVMALAFPYLSSANTGGNEFYPSLSSGLELTVLPDNGARKAHSMQGNIITLGRAYLAPKTLKGALNSVRIAVDKASRGAKGMPDKFCTHLGVEGEIEALPSDLGFTEEEGETLTIGRFENLKIPKWRISPNGVTQAPPNGRMPYLGSANTGLGCWGSWGPYRSCRIGEFRSAERLVKRDDFGSTSGTRQFSVCTVTDTNIRSHRIESVYSNCAWTSKNSSGYEDRYTISTVFIGFGAPVSQGKYYLANWQVSIKRDTYSISGAGAGARLGYSSTSTWIRIVTNNALVVGLVGQGGTVADVQQCERDVAFAWGQLLKAAPGRSAEAYGEALDNAIPALASNNIENAKQFVEAAASVPRFRDAIKELLPVLRESIKDVRATMGRIAAQVSTMGKVTGVTRFFKMAGNAYLAYRFVIKPTVKDLQDVYAKSGLILERDGQVAYGSGRGKVTKQLSVAGIDVTWTLREKTRVMSDGRVGFERLRRLGMAPTLSNAWDLIPFSWLVDYALGIQQLLKSLDQQLLPGVVNLGGCASVKSAKFNLVGMAGGIGLSHRFTGTANVWIYKRIVTFEVPAFEFTLESRPICQWWQVGVALLGTSLDVIPSATLPTAYLRKFPWRA